MKKLFIFICLLTFSILLNCRPGEDILASFEGGKIQRKHLREFYDLNDAPRNEKSMSVATQKMVVEQLAIQEIFEIESEKNKFFDRDDIKNILFFSEKEMIVNLFLKNFFESKKKSEPLELVNIQFALIYTNDEGKIQSAQNEISGLKDDEKIEEALSVLTQEEGRKCVGGHLEPQCINCSEQDQIIGIFQEGIQKNDSNFYVFKDGTKAFIYRINKRKKVYAEDLESHLSKEFKILRDKAINYTNTHNTDMDKQNAAYYLEDGERLEEKSKLTVNHFLKGFQNRVISSEIKRLQTEKQFKINEEMRVNPELFKQSETVLLSTPTESYKVANLEDDFKKIFPDSKNNENIQEKLNFFQGIIVPTKLISDTEDGDKIRKSENFKSGYGYLRRNLAYNIQKNEMEKNIKEVSDSEIKEIYEAGKQFQYSTPNPKNPSEKIPLPFESVKDRIKKEIISKEAESQFSQKIQTLKNNYKLELHLDKLKEGSI